MNMQCVFKINFERFVELFSCGLDGKGICGFHISSLI